MPTTQRTIRVLEELWRLGDTGEASVPCTGNARLPHPIEEAIKEADRAGYEIARTLPALENVTIIPSDKREKPYDSPVILFSHRGEEKHAAIVMRKSFLTGYNYILFRYEEVKVSPIGRA